MRIINISQEIFFYGALIYFLYIRYKSILKEKKNLDKVNELFIIIFGIYIIKLLSLVFFPILLQLGKPTIIREPIVWLNPLSSVKNIIVQNDLSGIIYNLLGNVILFIPLPTFIIYFSKKKLDNMKSIILVCFLSSLSIECIQYIQSIIISGVSRFIETNDIILNILGGVFGYILYDRYLRNL